MTLLPAILLAAQAAWLDVPFLRQQENGCGAAVLAMVMQYWRKPANPARIFDELYSPQARGIHESAMVRYLERNGFRAFAFRGEWQDLENHLAKGRPLIVCLGGSPRHYVVVAGIDDSTVSVNDPADRKLRKLGRPAFFKRWTAGENWTLLAVPRNPR